MAWLVIPTTPSVPDQTVICTILGTAYSFHFMWNDRASLWFLDATQADGTPIISSVAVVLRAFLGRTANQPPFSQGAFVAVDSSGKWQEAGIDDLGARVKVFFIPALDLEITRS